MSDHNEAVRLAEWLKARQSHLGSSRESCWDGEQRCWDNYDEAAALLRKLAADLKSARAETNRIIALLDAANDERKALRAEVERLTLSAARYEALRARHAYLIVSRLMGCESFSSETSRAQIDGFADKARAEVDAFNAMTPEQRRNELQAQIDTARKATQ